MTNEPEADNAGFLRDLIEDGEPLPDTPDECEKLFRITSVEILAKFQTSLKEGIEKELHEPSRTELKEILQRCEQVLNERRATT